MLQFRSDVDISVLAGDVHRALKCWYKDSSTGASLAHLSVVKQAQSAHDLDSREATNQVISAVLDNLTPNHEKESLVIHLRFLRKKTVRAVAAELDVSESQVFNFQRSAFHRLASALVEMEREANGIREALLSNRVPLATYSMLFGIDEHITRLQELLCNGKLPWLISIEGLGGLGKTSLARELLFQVLYSGSDFEDFAWVSAQQRSFHLSDLNLKSQAPFAVSELLDSLAGQILSESDLSTNTDEIMEALNKRLSSRAYLVIIDNLETLQDIEALLPALRKLVSPSKFVLTSRESLWNEPDVYQYSITELSRDDAIRLVREEARLRNLLDVATADEEHLYPIVETVGGNPLALKLVVGQLYLRPLRAVLTGLRESGNSTVDQLYKYIFWNAWQQLSETARSVLLLMPLFAQSGVRFESIQQVSDVKGRRLDEALENLFKLSLVEVAGGIEEKRYSIHRLTETFLLNEVLQWR